MSARSFIRMFAVLLLIVTTAVVGVLTVKAHVAVHRWDPDKARVHELPIPVRTVKVEESDLKEAIGATAVTIPAESATVHVVQGSAVRTLVKVNARLGTPVKKGDILFEFDERLFRQAVREREAALAAAQESMVATEKLYRDKAASGLDLSDAKVKLETAKLDLLVAQQDLKECRIESPLDGVVADVQAVPGERIDTSLDITQVHRLNPILVQMDFPQERIGALSLGQDAEVVLDSFPTRTFHGKVIRISPVADIETRVLPVMVEVQNPGNEIKAGLTGFVRIKMAKQGLSLPAAAVIRKGSKAMTFKVEQDRARIREIRVGQLAKNGMVEVLSGLQPGDEVVLFGNLTLQDNDRIDTNWRKWANRE